MRETVSASIVTNADPLVTDLHSFSDVEFLGNMKRITDSKQTDDKLSRDAFPKLGEVVSAIVRIAKSDDAEGKIEFAASRMEIAEGVGVVKVPVVRKKTAILCSLHLL